MYTVAKDGALCVWECDKTLSELTTLVNAHQRLRSGGDKEQQENDDTITMETEEANDNSEVDPPSSKKPRLHPTNNVCVWSKTAK